MRREITVGYGENLYERLGVQRGASTDEVRIGHDALKSRLPRMVGPLDNIHDIEVWHRLRDVEYWLLDPQRRVEYEEALARGSPTRLTRPLSFAETLSVAFINAAALAVIVVSGLVLVGGALVLFQAVGSGREREGDCDASYPGVCIPGTPPDLDCADVGYRRFQVVGTDPHGFDGDGDGIGCESG
jgi:hypothetical protein